MLDVSPFEEETRAKEQEKDRRKEEKRFWKMVNDNTKRLQAEERAREKRNSPGVFTRIWRAILNDRQNG